MEKEPIVNKDIIEFRYKLIELLCSEKYLLGPSCNDGSRIMTPQKKKVIEDILIEYNIFFSMRDYDIG